MSRSNPKRSRRKPLTTATPAEPQLPAELPCDDILESLQTLLKRFDQLDLRLDGWPVHAVASPDPPTLDSPTSSELQEDLLHLQATLDEAWRANEELRHQNQTLAAQVAQSSVRQTVQASSGCDESLSWEQRKELIIQQMEQDAFDADEFVNSLSAPARQLVDPPVPESQQAILSPHAFVENLVERIERAEQTIRNRDAELSELRMLLENQPGTRDQDTAIGAAAIASMIDSDALVREERERLQQLKNDWEDKFRQAEIDASLERAKLSRERQELAKRSQELEEKFHDLQRERREHPGVAKTGRRWLAELGLSNDAHE